MNLKKKIFACVVNIVMIFSIILLIGNVYAIEEDGTFNVYLQKNEHIVSITGEDTATTGSDYTCSIVVEEGYNIKYLTVYVGSNHLKPEKYSFDDETGILTIDGDAITNSISVFVNGDERTPVKAITATTGDGDITPAYGDVVADPVFISDAYFPSNMGDWYKKVDEEWTEVIEGSIFTEGTYKYEAQIRIDEVSTLDGNEYILNHVCNVTVDDVAWSTMIDPSSGNEYSYNYSESPEYVIDKPADAPLVFANYPYSIKSYNKIAIDEIKLALFVSGGDGSYTYTKTSGPEWINVSNKGVITGTPTFAGNNNNLVVRVTDELGQYREITITVNATKVNPADRTKVSSIIATTNGGNIAPRYGDVVADPVFTSNAYFPSNMGDWYKKVDEEWTEVTKGSTFIEGTYKYEAQIRIDEVSTLNGEQYVLANPCTVTVDGVAWSTMIDPASGNEYSYNYSESPEFVILDPAYLENGEVIINETLIIYSGSAKEPSVIVRDANGRELTKDVDYTVAYSNNINIGSAKVIVTGIGSYQGTKETDFEITFNPVKVDAKKATTTSDGYKTHYEIKETDVWCKDAGCTEIIENHNDYIISKVTSVKLSYTSYTYNGNVKSPTLTIKDSTGKTLKYGIDYTYTRSSGRKNVGTYYYYVTLKGNYSGKKTLSFKINPKGTTILTPYRGKGYITAKWNRVSTKMSKYRIYGYQIAYATKSDFSNAKYKYPYGYRTTSYKIKSLKRNTYYYVKVRTRLKVNGKYYYSTWSKVKKVKTR